MTDTPLVQKKLAFILNELKELKKYEHLSEDQILEDYTAHTCIERIIERIVHSAIDINSHIIAEMSEKVSPESYKNSFLDLIDLHILPKDFGEDISKSAGLRNILVHEYQSLDESIFYKSFQLCLKNYPLYCHYISAFLEKQ